MATPEFILPSWLRDQDAETIHKRMMEKLPVDIDDTEGGFPWDFTKPTALEKAELLEFHLVETLKIMFPAWAYDQWLDLHATAAGTKRKAANPAYGILEITGTPGTEIPAGFRFASPAVGDMPAVEFAAEETAYIAEDGTARVGVVAVETGTTGNVPAGTIAIMAQPIKGISSITNPEKTSGGTEPEDDDSLRKRIDEINQAAEASFVGCDADYKRWAKEVAGVGDAFVIPEWNPDVPNSVKVVILDANGEPANEKIQRDVYDYIYSPNDRMERKAPVGAILTVAAPTPNTINYAFVLQLRDGYGLQAVLEQFSRELRDYYATAKEENVVRYAMVGSILINTAGVRDFDDLTLNGSTDNIDIGEDEYPVTGTINPGITAAAEV